MLESYVDIDGEVIFCRHSPLAREKKTLLFIHGLGESSLCFREAFDLLNGLECNLLAPDNVGYGRSSAARDGDYAFTRQIERLQKLLNRLSIEDVVLIGHSLGGMLATLWTEYSNEDRVLAVVNVEGNLFPSDASHSRLASEQYLALGEQFDAWMAWYQHTFLQKQVLEQNLDEMAVRRCYASMWFSRPQAFLGNAQEILSHTHWMEGEQETAQSRTYASAKIPTLYCWGKRSAPQSTVDWLISRELPNLEFERSGHWPMIDEPDKFYGTVRKFACDLP